MAFTVFTQHPLPASMSKHIFTATLSDPDVIDAGAETKEDEEPGKSGDLSSDSDGEPSPLKLLKAYGQTGEAMEASEVRVTTVIFTRLLCLSRDYRHSPQVHADHIFHFA